MSNPSLAVAFLIAASTVPAPGPEAPIQGNIEDLVLHNADFRRVLFTGGNIQVVAMSLPAGVDIGMETHPKVDQCFFFVSGSGQAVVDGKPSTLAPRAYLCVPAGHAHDIRNTGKDDLKLFTLYAPPQHPPGTVHHTKADAEKAEAAKSR